MAKASSIKAMMRCPSGGLPRLWPASWRAPLKPNKKQPPEISGGWRV
jgi:hypothetical protein